MRQRLRTRLALRRLRPSSRSDRGLDATCKQAVGVFIFAADDDILSRAPPGDGPIEVEF
jgi:hypothetical protein